MTTKHKIIHESLKLFSLKGYSSTGIQDILQVTNSSKGGFYNHFASKEELFYAVLKEAQRKWRTRVFLGLEDLKSPTDKVITILRNYKDRYLTDRENFPGGCIFVTLSVELDDQHPHLALEVNRGFVGFHRMLKRLLDEAKANGEMIDCVDTQKTTQLVFTGMLGASVLYGVTKSTDELDANIEALITFLNGFRQEAN